MTRLGMLVRVLVALAILLGATGTPAPAQEIVMATWGGAWGKAFQESRR